MPAPAPTSKLVQFGIFELDLQRAELRKQGIRIKLQEQPLKLLQLLLENPGQIISREQLRTSIWPADTTVQFDQGLYSAMARLRDALGDSPESPRFIETVARRGYRFIAPTTALPSTLDKELEQLIPSAKTRTRIVFYRITTSLLTSVVGGGLILAIAFALNIGGLTDWLHSRTGPIHSIAVLPLENLSGDPGMDYLAEGISEEITNSLSRLPTLQVMARSTVLHNKSPQQAPQQIGHKLHVDAVLTGRLLEHGDELEVETELVAVTNGAQFWGKRYTRRATDASSLSAAISRDAASQLRPGMSGAERESFAKIGTRDAEAYQLYLRGRLRLEGLMPEDLHAAAEFFDKAIDRDPGFAAAYAGLADVYASQGYFAYVPGRAVFEKARASAKRALDLDSEIPESNISLAMANMFFFWNFPEAQASLEKALALDPNSAYAHEVYCWFNFEMGKGQPAVAECRKAVDLEPLSPLYNIGLSQAYYLAREYDQSLQQASHTLEIAPLPGVAYQIEEVDLATGDYKGAMEQRFKSLNLFGYELYAKKIKMVFDKTGYREYLGRLAKDNEVVGQFFDAATDYALLGEKDAAFAALNKAAAAGIYVDRIELDPLLDNLRPDSRYISLLHRIGLPSGLNLGEFSPR